MSDEVLNCNSLDPIQPHLSLTVNHLQSATYHIAIRLTAKAIDSKLMNCINKKYKITLQSG